MKIGNTTVKLEFNLEVIFVGVLWHREERYDAPEGYSCSVPHHRLEVWVCLVPGFPLHFVKTTRRTEAEQLLIDGADEDVRTENVEYPKGFLLSDSRLNHFKNL